MKKLFNKFLAGAISLALIATLAFGVSFAKNASADGVVTLGTWTFEQGGQYNPGEAGDEGYISRVTMDGTSESITGWKQGSGSKEQTQSATQVSNGFALGITNTGWNAQWKAETGNPVTTINPWSIQAWVESPMEAAHVYKVTFKAHASKNKNAYVTFKTSVDGQEMNPYDNAPMRAGSDEQFVQFGTSDKTYTYIFDNFVGGTNLTTKFMLGAFTADEDDHHLYDYGQNCIDDLLSAEVGWKNGTVYVSDFQIEDLGVNPDVPTDPPAPTQAPTQAPTVAPQPTQAPTAAPQPTTKPTPKKLGKVTGLKGKNTKKKTIKVSWKAVAHAKTYEIKAGTKTYKATATSKKIKNKKFKKGKKVKVKVRATATGYTTGAWSKVKKIKIKK